MKKILLTIAFLACFWVIGFAQTVNRFSVGLDAGIPVGNGLNTYNAVVGGSVKFEAPLATKIAFTLSAGYSAFLGKTTYVEIGDEGITYTPESYTAIPVKVGIKYYFTEGLYGEGQLGAAVGLKSGSKVGFAWAPGLGYEFGNSLDIGLRYEGWSITNKQVFGSGNITTLSQVAVRLGFHF